MPLLERLGNYELLLELASGGMATVYVARQVGGAGFERLVVIKRVHAHLLKDRAFTDMLRDEARMCSTIRHPNVVPVIDVIETDHELLLVLEYVESLTLSTMLRIAEERGELLPPPIVSRIVVDALAGLHAAHEAVDLHGTKMDLIHRDVSPQNIIVGLDGTSRLIDFGVAKASSRITTTRDGVVKGKLRYMSPEQVRQKPLDRRADVFAAGVVLYEALTGKPAFPGADAGDIAVSILLGDVPPISSVEVDLPSELDTVVTKALASHRDERYATAAELQEALERALPPANPREVAGIVESMGSASFERRRAELRSALASTSGAGLPRRRARRFFLGIGGAVAVTLAALAVLLFRGTPPSDAKVVTGAGARGEASTFTATEPAIAMPVGEAVPSASTSTSASSVTSASPSTSPTGGRTRRTKPAASGDLRRKNPYGTP